MFLRCALLASATAICAAMLAPASADTSLASARCDEANFRIYFAPEEARLDPVAVQALRLAERGVADCGYAELHVLVDASASKARERGAAIVAAADARAWNVVRVERRAPMQRVSAGPDFAEVVMTPRVMPAGEPLTTARNVGV